MSPFGYYDITDYIAYGAHYMPMTYFKNKG